MSTELFRRYIDIVEGREQINEGMIDDVKAKFSEIWTKLKAMPGFAEAYEKAKAMEPELKQILQSSSSGKEAADKIKNLVSSNAGATTNEGMSDYDFSRNIAAVGIGGLLVQQLTGLLDVLIDVGLKGNWGPAVFLLGSYVMFALAGLFGMIHAGSLERQNRNAIQRQQDLSKQ